MRDHSDTTNAHTQTLPAGGVGRVQLQTDKTGSPKMHKHAKKSDEKKFTYPGVGRH